MGAELYGNHINTNGHEAHIIADWGGRVTTHHNNATNSSDPVLVKVYSDCPGVEPIERQKMNNTYHFQNRVDVDRSHLSICNRPVLFLLELLDNTETAEN